MYLKSIKSHGFKSFADITEIELKPGITGIVGPNGSGKSNVVDAVKWVLGEQSIKALRATNSMSDVIFTGSKSRKAMNRAYVALTFTNEDKYLNTEFTTVEIKRVLYRTGENEYFINNNKVRLKDITDLFIDSGAGRESFNIISQGSVADVINSKPEERRIIFESAAGVLKYKKRKEETNRKLIKVKDNLEKIDLIIAELEDNHHHLERQAKIAQEYLTKKENLENLEVALIAKEISGIDKNSKILKNEVANLTKELDEVNLTNNNDNVKMESLKLENIKLDEKIATLNANIIKLSNEIADLNSEKKLTIERQKYEVSDTLLESNLLNLKEEELAFKNSIKSIKKDLDILRKDYEIKEKQYQEALNEYQLKTTNSEKINMQILSKNKEQLSLANQIEILESNIENSEKLPLAVRGVLNNPRLKKVHNTIGNLIEVDDKYATAIDTVLGYSANIIVVDDLPAAAEAIDYLKTNKLGRATFFPLNIIKKKTIDDTTLNILKSTPGFINVANLLVKNDAQYNDIIANQLGNVIVVDNINTLNQIGKKINYRYRIVSLDGEILHTGGAISGGTYKNANSTIIQKEKLNKLKNANDKLVMELDNLEKNSKQISEQLKAEHEKLSVLNSQFIMLKESVNRKEITLKDAQEKYSAKQKELTDAQNIKENKLESSLNKVLEAFYQKTSEKELLEKDLNDLKNQKNTIFLQLNELEKNNREKTSDYNMKIQQLKTKEIEVGKMDVRLDNLLNTLNETYNMTYEKALAHYSLDLEESIATKQVMELKKAIANLGNVNTGAIEEYKRVHERYTFLTNQKNDLASSIVNLENIISEMDNIMIERFSLTFKKIEAEFQNVFHKLFKGGTGSLKLTNPEDILQTGIEIIAEPPGKKLNSIGLLSGGEKTLTAISLLFAILNVNPVPFVILDEVEAALDEANVEMFGKYLLEKKHKSQFIIITHKKKTMEYADVLYGITMQESGISKLVSVKLENL